MKKRKNEKKKRKRKEKKIKRKNQFVNKNTIRNQTQNFI